MKYIVKNIMCIHLTASEILETELKWIDYDKATHVVVGFCKCGNGGVLMTADNEFSAYRYAKVYARNGFSAKVRPCSDETFKDVSDQISNSIEQL